VSSSHLLRVRRSSSDRSGHVRAAQPPPSNALRDKRKDDAINRKDDIARRGAGSSEDQAPIGTSRFPPSGGTVGTISSNRKMQNRWERVSQLMREEATRDMWGAFRINTYATAGRYSLAELAVRIRLSRGTWTEPEARLSVPSGNFYNT